MEEKSLPLVQKSQSTSETLDQIHASINRTIIEQNEQVEELQMRINQLEESIKHEIEREISCQNILMYTLLFQPNFSSIIFSEYKNSKDEPLIEQMRATIETLYKKYLLSDDTGISTVHMLQAIENKIKSLFNQIETMDSSLVIEAEKVFEKEEIDEHFFNDGFSHEK